MHSVPGGFDGIPTVSFRAVFRNRKTYGAVRCCDVLRCSSVRSSKTGSPTVHSVRFSEIVKPTVRFGEVFRCQPYGAVRVLFCVVRSGLVYGAVLCGFHT